jgi:hypothetical protein
MVYTFGELTRQVLVKLDEVGATTTEEVAGNELNNAHATLCNERQWSWMVDEPRTLTTRVGVREITLPAYTQRLLYVRNPTTGQRLLNVPQREYAQMRPAVEGLTGPATHYVRWGMWPVKRQPDAATALRLVSDSALDTGTDYNIAIKGLDANGEERALVITPAGTTPVDSTVEPETITGVVKTQEWNGNLTITNVAGDETYLTLFPWEMGRQYPVLYLLQEPTTAETLEYRVVRQPLLMVNTYDVPMIPGASALILVYDTLIQMSTTLRDINPTDIEIWTRERDKISRNLYSQELGNELFSEDEQVHPVDDGWDDVF